MLPFSHSSLQYIILHNICRCSLLFSSMRMSFVLFVMASLTLVKIFSIICMIKPFSTFAHHRMRHQAISKMGTGIFGSSMPATYHRST